jgi:hypothetical protein
MDPGLGHFSRYDRGRTESSRLEAFEAEKPNYTPRMPDGVLLKASEMFDASQGDSVRFEKQFRSVDHFTTKKSLVVQARELSSSEDPPEIAIEFIRKEKLSLQILGLLETGETSQGRWTPGSWNIPIRSWSSRSMIVSKLESCNCPEEACIDSFMKVTATIAFSNTPSR